MRDEIILIGPIGAGKSTQGRLLSEHLCLPQCSMDDLRWTYYKEIGYSDETAQRISEAEGFVGLYHYWKPFEAHAVERLLTEHRDCVIDFGAGHSVFEDGTLFDRVKKALLPFKNVVLLLPLPDPDDSIRALHKRKWAPAPDEFDINAHFVRHHSNQDLATVVMYTEGRTPEQTRDDILAAVAAHRQADSLSEPYSEH